MNQRIHRVFLSAVLALLVVACQRTDDAANARPSAEPAQHVTNTAPIAQVPAHDPSVPDAATALARDAANDAAATKSSEAAREKADPQKVMTKEEESKAMPLPSQANDHSSTALDKRSGK